MSSSSSDYGFEDHTTLTNPAAVFGAFTNGANGNALAAFENGFNIKNKSSSKFVTLKSQVAGAALFMPMFTTKAPQR